MCIVLNHHFSNRAFSVSNNSPSLNRNKDEEGQNTTPDQSEKAQSSAGNHYQKFSGIRNTYEVLVAPLTQF